MHPGDVGQGPTIEELQAMVQAPATTAVTDAVAGPAAMPPNPKQIYGDAKLPVALVPSSATLYTGMAMAEGARKYGAYNWREKAVELMTYVHACNRHLMAWVDGEIIDPESGVPHLGHALACLSIMVDAIECGNAIDNRPPKGPAGDILRRFAAEKQTGVQ